MNKVILMGRLTRDPEVRYSQGGENESFWENLLRKAAKVPFSLP